MRSPVTSKNVNWPRLIWHNPYVPRQSLYRPAPLNVEGRPVKVQLKDAEMSKSFSAVTPLHMVRFT